MRASKAAELAEQALRAQRAGHLNEAEKLCKKLLELSPNSAELQNNLGLVRYSLGKHTDAVRALRVATTLNPRNAPYHANLAVALHALGQLEPSVASARRALELDARLPSANNTLGLALLGLDRVDEAETAFKAALMLDPRYAEAQCNLALLYLKLEHFAEAEACAAKAIRLRPTYAKAYVALGDAYQGQLKEIGAAEAFKRAFAMGATTPDVRVRLGSALKRVGDSEGGREQLQLAVREAPDFVSGRVALGNFYRERGELDAAATQFRAALSLQPTPSIHRLLSTTVKHQSRDDDVLAMEAAYPATAEGTEERMQLAFGLGKALEDLKDYAAAFDLFAEANRIHRLKSPYSEAQEREKFDALMSTLTQDFAKSVSKPGHDTTAPIFIVGMPRSGTTLTEQIIASHPLVYGGGELPFMAGSILDLHGFNPTKEPRRLRDLEPGLDPLAIGEKYLSWLPEAARRSERFTDKLPHNFQMIGLIKLVFPRAKVIHVSRSPVDTCLSNFKNAFAAEGLNYSYELGELGRYYNLYRRIMRHWETALPQGAYFTLQYEALVENPEPVTRDLFGYLELEWTPEVLEFHTSKREIHTASFAQVRQPISTGSVNLSDRYGARLDPLREALAEWTDD